MEDIKCTTHVNHTTLSFGKRATKLSDPSICGVEIVNLFPIIVGTFVEAEDFAKNISCTNSFRSSDNPKLPHFLGFYIGVCAVG